MHEVIKFEIAEFCPSISENQLNQSMEKAKSFTKISSTL